MLILSGLWHVVGEGIIYYIIGIIRVIGIKGNMEDMNFYEEIFNRMSNLRGFEIEPKEIIYQGFIELFRNLIF